MPTYDYECVDCGSFDALRSMADRNQPAECPGCGSAADRVMVAAPRLAQISDQQRSAMATNERARHEPASSRDDGRYRHRAGCSCCSSVKSKATVTTRQGNKFFPSHRPWMISH
jgi:putative FmdB family regulatory protein